MKTLTLTSPLTHNDDVTDIQKLLKNKGWLQGSVDGIYGPATARSVRHAKYVLGYPTPDSIAGDTFRQYLIGTKKRGPLMLATAAARARAKPPQPKRVLMLAEAKKWIGTKESPPKSNIVFFTKWYGMTGPWCAMFVTFCGDKVGLTAFKQGQRWAYVPYMVHDARAGINGLVEVFEPAPGDLAAYDWDDDGVADHVEIFDKWINRGVTFATVGGNTGHFDASNGGEVLPMTRNTSDVQAWIRVTK
jgi:hypothetical protein